MTTFANMLAMLLSVWYLMAVIKFATNLSGSDILLELGESGLWLSVILFAEKRLFLHICHDGSCVM